MANAIEHSEKPAKSIQLEEEINAHLHLSTAFLRQLNQELAERLTESFSIKELAEDIMGCSTSKLEYEVKKYNKDYTPSKYVQSYKVEIAKHKLKESSCSIQEISQQLGFKKQGRFAEIFKKITKLTPSVYRKQHKK